MLLALLSLPLYSTSFSEVPAASRFARIDIGQGLSQTTVTSLAQDHSGNIWIGTQSGLNRYDGFAVQVFLPEQQLSQSLSDNFVTSLLVDNQGMLWVGTLNGLNHFDPVAGTFKNISLAHSGRDSEPLVLALHLDTQQRLWIGTNQGLAMWQHTSQQAQWFGDTNQYITALSADNAGNLWLGTPRGLIRFDHQTEQLITVKNFPYPDASVMTLYHDKAGRLWVGLEREGLLMQQPGAADWTELDITSYSNGVSSKEIRSIIMDNAGDIWVGTQHGLSRLSQHNGRWQQQVSYHHQRNNPSSLGNGKVTALLQDQDDSIWIGTWNGGVSRLNLANNLFISISRDLALMDSARNPATISLAAYNTTLWAGTADGLFTLDLAGVNFSLATAISKGLTFYCSLQRSDEIWFGHGQGIVAVNPANGDYRQVPLPADVPPGPVRRLWYSDNLLWLAIDQFGLVVLNEASQRIVAQYPFSRAITFIEPVGQHYVLVGSYQGLSWFQAADASLIYEHSLAAGDSAVLTTLPAAPMAYLKTADDRHWLATNGTGLFELILPRPFHDPALARFRQYSEAGGLASGQLKAAELDEAGNIWLSSAFGISVFSPASERFRNFGYRHGALRSDYINASSTTMADGTIVFGGMDGFTLFQPQQVLNYSAGTIAAPAILDIEVNGRKIALPQATLTIPATDNRRFSVHYSTREFIETTQVQFQYRLDPVTSDWITQNDTGRSASFERLPPGDYLFRLRAGLAESGWSNETTLKIKVKPLWWETWLARTLLAGLLLGMLYGLHLFRLKHLRKQQEEMAWLVEQRTEALNERSRALQESKNKAEQTLLQLESTVKELVRTEKMAALGQLVAGVAHEVNTPLGVALTANSVVTEESQLLQQKLASGNIRRQELDNYLSKLVQAGQLLDNNLQRAAQLVANFKQVSVDLTADNQRQFNLARYLDELLDSLSLMWRNRKVRLQMDCPDTIVMDSFPGTIGQIITNFTQNAVIHGFQGRDSGEITIECRRLDDQVEIRFADNGTGISNENIERIFDPFFTTNRQQGGSGLGLHIVFNLITQKLGGTVKVSSTPGKGTCFTLRLPLKATVD
ncbi:two-component regulator propeller domain-containing protein [Arsukibacterium sp.]|uniref:two-component regulator propeller domain-containing protein n=1 Tax=Arsukibacterium sp. TaxID=1977258 RepID=UPI00299CE1D7|nr:two-component regulator propeller domain-containing protein [Arsukibacterium sp.]MDX1676518.1 two-component regulator propeller domain-containing protein [Arsukibacterium sp.]